MQHVARSLIIVGDPFLGGRVPMMGVVEVFPEWPPWIAFTFPSEFIQCAAEAEGAIFPPACFRDNMST